MRPISITNELSTADPNGISVDQATAEADDLAIDGVLASGGVATLDSQRKVLFTSGVNLSTLTITITGTNDQGQIISESLAGPNAGTVSTVRDYLTITQIAVDATWGVNATNTLTLLGNAVAAETVTLGTQVYTWDAAPSAPDEVLVGADADASIDNLIAAINNAAGEGTLYGTGTAQNTFASAVAGGGDTMDVVSLIGGTAGNATATTEAMGDGDWDTATLLGGLQGGLAGTSGVGASAPIPIDQYLAPTNIGLGVVVSGTVDVTVQHSFDDPFDPDPDAIPTWFDSDSSDLVNASANQDGNFAFPPRMIRLLTNSGTGIATLTVVQAGAVA